jgi:hypothetical protein
MLNRSIPTHRFTNIRRGIALGAALALSAAVAHAADAPTVVPTTVGAPFPSIVLTDQNDHPVSLPGNARWIVLVNERVVDEWADPVIAALGQGRMNADRLVYVSDISRMPSMISKLFALPQMRKRNYPVALIRDDKTAAQMPSRKGCAMLIGLKADATGSEEAVCSAGELKARLDGLKVD